MQGPRPRTTPARRGVTGAERTAIARHARHRACYTLDTATLEVTGGPRGTRGAQLSAKGTETVADKANQRIQLYNEHAENEAAAKMRAIGYR